MSNQENPYASPQEVSAAAPVALSNRQMAKKRLQQPGWVTILGGLVGTPALLFVMGVDLYRIAQKAPDDGDLRFRDVATMLIILFMFPLLGGVFCLYGGIQMLRVRQYRVCVATAALMTIPCTSPCNLIGIVVGIWTLLVLLRKDTRAAFGEAD